MVNFPIREARVLPSPAGPVPILPNCQTLFSGSPPKEGGEFKEGLISQPKRETAR